MYGSAVHGLLTMAPLLPLSCRFTWKSLLPLSQLLVRCPKLSHLDLSINCLGSSSSRNGDPLKVMPFDRLTQALEGCTHLSVLDLSCLQLSDRDIAGLFESVAVMRLTKLYLRSNDLHDGTAVKIGQLLPAMRLQVLSLAGNQIGNRGLSAMVFVLDQTKTLRTLDLEENQVSASIC